MRFAGQTPTIASILTSWIDGKEVPQSQLWENFQTPRTDYVLDPVQLASAYGTPVHQAIAQNSAQWEKAQASKPVDLGSAEMDLFLRNLGIRSNLSGLKNPPTAYYPISDQIQYKRQHRPARGGSADTLGTTLEFIKLADTPMMDWDVPDPRHLDRNVTVRHLGDVEELLRQYVGSHPESRIQLYQTPGGFRAWELGEKFTPEQFQDRFQQLKVDPDYAALSRTGRNWNVRGVAVDPPGFSSRISHKPGRSDWVAQPIATFGEGMPDPTSLELVRELHDEPIRRSYLGPSGVNPQAVATLKRQLPTASETLQRQLARRFRI